MIPSTLNKLDTHQFLVLLNFKHFFYLSTSHHWGYERGPDQHIMLVPVTITITIATHIILTPYLSNEDNG